MQVSEEALVTLLRWYGGEEADEAPNTHPVLVELAVTARALWERDYECLVIANDLCSTYPPELVIPVAQRGGAAPLLHDEALRAAFADARLARARGRFPVPVLLLGRAYLVRSATLAVKGEALLSSAKSAVTGFFTRSPTKTQSAPTQLAAQSPPAQLERQESLISRARRFDVALLRVLGVQYVADLMLEHKKAVRGIVVTSSEKADSRQRYAEFALLSLPFPGTEAAKDYSKNELASADVVWHATELGDAVLSIPPSLGATACFVEWGRWRQFGLSELTASYAGLLQRLLGAHGPATAAAVTQSMPELPTGAPPPIPSRVGRVHGHLAPAGSVLIHCLSGWDRTPAFCCLLRSVMWADGLVHSSLDPLQFLALTLSWDWILFRHRFADRMKKHEEVLFFCFSFLQHTVRCDPPLLSFRQLIPAHLQACISPLFASAGNPGARRERLQHLCALFFTVYGAAFTR